MNVYYFPSDKQVRHVNFTNWMYTALLVNLTLMSDTLILDGFHNHSEWLLVDTAVSSGKVALLITEGESSNS